MLILVLYMARLGEIIYDLTSVIYDYVYITVLYMTIFWNWNPK